MCLQVGVGEKVCAYPVVLGRAELARRHGVSPVFEDRRVVGLDAVLRPGLARSDGSLEGPKHTLVRFGADS